MDSPIICTRDSGDLEAEATFKLAVWFQQDGRDDLAAKYFERAQALNPDDWNYHRQAWSFTPHQTTIPPGSQ